MSEPPTGAPRMRIEPGSFYAALALALKQGVPVASIIDLGCADGNFSVTARRMAPLAGATLMNIDAQAFYEPSLSRIQRVLGGHYRICAVADRRGTTTLTTGAHPYWSSLRTPSDDYWRQHQGAYRETVPVPVHTLDDIVRETSLPPPHLIKLDVQGAELAALAGAPRTLADTNFIIVETFVWDFGAIHRLITESGFALFDLTELNRGADHRLAWFYPIYVHQRFGMAAPGPLWAPEHSATVLANQAAHRANQLRELDEILGPLEAAHGATRSDET